MDMKSLLIRWTLMFLTNATDGKSPVDCNQNKQMLARGIFVVTCHTPVKGGQLAINVTFLPDDAQLPPE